MASPSPQPPRVFISYSHDSPQHAEQVLELAERLRKDGTDAQIDQYVSGTPPEGWRRWMHTQVEQANRVLLIFTETYQRRFEAGEEEGKGLGATFEGVIVTQRLYDDETEGGNAKFRPVVFRQEDERFIPSELRRFNRYRVDTPEHYQNLLRWLYTAPSIVAPTVGQKPDLPPEPVPELFSSKREREEQERLETEQREKERLDAERSEKQRLAVQQREKDRVEAEQRARERLETEQREKERSDSERSEKQRLAVQQREKDRVEAEQRARERLETEQTEKERLLAEQEKERQERRQREEQENERVVAHGDAPAIVDQLERDTFAEVIATRIKEVWKARRPNGSRTEDVPIGAFMIHVHGPWGSGKTSVLNFLSAYLKKEDPSEQHDKKEGPSNQWVIVNFNAWRYQRIRPPWWTLIREIYLQSVHSVGFSRSLSLRVWWWFWRIQADWLPVVSAAVLMAVAVLLASGVIKFTPHQPAPASAFPSPTASAMELGLKVLTAVLAAGASLVAFSRSLVFGSARAAQTYIDLKSDPLRPIINIFENVVKAVKRPVVVFVDDLDRCESKYVVELLEGIQTLFREAPITYVVAADRKWICSSFEKEYDAFGKTIGEPGRPLGYLFLDKMFQISVSVPRLLPEVQRRYWEALLRARTSNDSESVSARHEHAEREQAKLQALDEMKAEGADTPEKLQEMIDSALGDPLREQAIRAAAATQITSPPVSQKSEHRLQPFAPLLEPNPRSMKRLVNAYGMHLATHFLEGRPVSPESIARWTIIELRWPLLADFLAARPQSVAVLASGKVLTDLHSTDDVEKPQGLEKLYDDEEVKAVLGYAPKGAMALDERSIRQIVG